MFDGSGHDPFCANCQSKGANLTVSQKGTGTLFARCWPQAMLNQLQTMTDHMQAMTDRMAMMPEPMDMHKKSGKTTNKDKGMADDPKK